MRSPWLSKTRRSQQPNVTLFCCLFLFILFLAFNKSWFTPSSTPRDSVRSALFSYGQLETLDDNDLDLGDLKESEKEKSLSKGVLSDALPVQVFVHRLVSDNATSWLSCRFTPDRIRKALLDAAQVWKAQANIELLFDHNMPPQHVDAEMDKEYDMHLKKYTGNKFVSALMVAEDLARIVRYGEQNSWHKENGIHLYCIGGFAGNNGVTDDNRIFIRSVEYRASELPIDDFSRFARVLAHEIGHTLHLKHPKVPSCLQSCQLQQCNLMCQQRTIPKRKTATSLQLEE